MNVYANQNALAVASVTRITELVGHTAVPPALRAILGSGLVREGGCVFLSALRSRAPALNLDAFPDRTGAECFVNHIHLSDDLADHDEQELWQMSLAVGGELCRLAQALPIRVIVSQGPDETTVRFHERRVGESWVADDLEACLDERVVVIDS